MVSGGRTHPEVIYLGWRPRNPAQNPKNVLRAWPGRPGVGTGHESDEDDDGQYVGNDQQKLKGDIKPYTLKSDWIYPGFVETFRLSPPARR